MTIAECGGKRLLPLPRFLRNKGEQKKDEKTESDKEPIDITKLKSVLGEEQPDKSPAPQDESDLIYIKSMDLQGLSDIQQVSGELERGNIVIMYIGRLQYGQSRELRRVVDQLRGICRSMGGDIAQLGQDYIVITPSFVKIYKKSS
jgi:SepF-like predicted cell division protein (DUF552 family)